MRHTTNDPYHNEIHNFCLDWNNPEYPRIELHERYKHSGWDFSWFKWYSKKFGWYVESMESLEITIAKIIDYEENLQLENLSLTERGMRFSDTFRKERGKLNNIALSRTSLTKTRNT